MRQKNDSQNNSDGKGEVKESAASVTTGTAPVDQLASLATKIKDGDQRVLASEKASTVVAIETGIFAHEAKQQLKRSKLKTTFEKWLWENCKLKYQRVYNYMRLAAASQTDISLKEMGLTDAYIKLGLVSRRAPQKVKKSKKVRARAGDTSVLPPERHCGAYVATLHDDHYMIEVSDDWGTRLVDAISDAANFAALLDAGLLIRRKPVAAVTATDTTK